MTTVHEIERAIGNLSPREIEELLTWMDERFPQPIDEQIAADLSAGRIDNRIQSALASHAAGRSRAL